MPPRPIEEYQVGWVCALPKELTATRAILDEQYKSQIPHDKNIYVLLPSAASLVPLHRDDDQSRTF